MQEFLRLQSLFKVGEPKNSLLFITASQPRSLRTKDGTIDKSCMTLLCTCSAAFQLYGSNDYCTVSRWILLPTFLLSNKHRFAIHSRDQPVLSICPYLHLSHWCALVSLETCKPWSNRWSMQPRPYACGCALLVYDDYTLPAQSGFLRVTTRREMSVRVAASTCGASAEP